MAANAYWADDWTTLNLETDAGTPTEIPVAGIQEIEIVASVSIETLFTGDSVKPEAKKQHEFEPTVNIGYSKFDPIIAREWLGGDGGGESASMADQSDPQKYSLTATFESVGGNETWNIEATGITFEDMPLVSASRGEYIQWDLEGNAMDITDASTGSA